MRLLVVNPFASSVTEERIEQVARALGDVEIRRTEHRGHATELARQARGAEAVYAWELVRMLAERRGRIEPALEILGRGRAAFALVANGDPYTYAGPVPIRIAPEARFELGIDLVAPRGVRPVDLPRLFARAFLG